MSKAFKNTIHVALLGLGSVAALSVASGGSAQDPGVRTIDAAKLQGLCSAEALQPVLAGNLSTTVTVKPIGNGPFKTATRFVPATDRVPAFCQVTGSFVTNPQTGKTANFLATLPANWNGKYLQSGCSGHCGQFFVNNPAMPSYTVTGQGYPDQVITKGYAHFATDEGHEGMDYSSWAVRKDGTVDQDFVEDWLYRADQVLARAGKEFATAFYAQAAGERRAISRSYFNGCSGGGRDAMVAASYFPEEFDGIIAGSAYEPAGVQLQRAAIMMASNAPNAKLTPGLLSLMDGVVKAQCDALDGVKDGVIQNPAACNFRPERDLPKCDGDKPGDQCFTSGQIQTISAMITGVTDDRGTLLQPGYSVSELQSSGDAGRGETLKVFVRRNDPNFSMPSVISLRSGGPGKITYRRGVVTPEFAVATRDAFARGMGHTAQGADRLMESKTKLLMWHNLSDEALTPYMSINWYKALAGRHGGYPAVQKQVRLFPIPGTSHCSISGIAPNSFDALTAMEDWVERGKAPDALRASVADRQFTPGAPKAPALQYPNWTATLCKFPEMARYSGTGDVKDANNWSCSPNDKRMLQVGESGRRAGVS